MTSFFFLLFFFWCGAEVSTIRKAFDEEEEQTCGAVGTELDYGAVEDTHFG